MRVPKDVEDKIIDVGALILRKGALDPKVKALACVASAVANRCTHCHGQGRSLAAKLGATPEEIAEAEALGKRIQIRCENEGGLYPMK